MSTDTRTTQNVRDYIHQSRFFADLPNAALDAACAAARMVQVPEDSFLFHQGDLAQQFYLLCTGQMRLIQITPEGQQIIMGLLSPIRELGIVAAIPQAEYPLTTQALTDASLLTWNSADLTLLIEQYPVLALRSMRMVTGRFVQLQNLYRELATLRVEQRVARALLRLARQAGDGPEDGNGTLIRIPLSRQNLADMTGTTLYTVSRIMSGWEQRGIVQSRRERVMIRDLAMLTALADDLPAAPAHEPPPC